LTLASTNTVSWRLDLGERAESNGGDAMKLKIALLATCLAVAVAAQHALDDKTRVLRAQSVSNAKQLALAMLLYCSDYDDVFPYVQDTKATFVVTYPYVKDLSVTKTLNPMGGEFVFNRNVGGVAAGKIPDPALTPMYVESKFWPDDRRIVAYVDCRVKAEPRANWAKVEKSLQQKFPRKAKKPLPPGDKLAKDLGIKF